MRIPTQALLAFTVSTTLHATSSAWTPPRLSNSPSPTQLHSSPPTTTTLKKKSETTDGAAHLGLSGYDRNVWKKGYTSCRQEFPPTVLDCPDLPDDFPAGTYYRNGPARFESDDGVLVYHMFDGDGMVVGLTVDPESKKLLFRNRFVRTEGYIQDKEKGIMSKPGLFGTAASGGFFKNLFRTDFKHVANTHMLYQGDKLYALWEGGWPYVLDPLTLENDVHKEPEGHDLNGLLQKRDKFAAHYRYDPRSGNVVTFGMTLDPLNGATKMTLWEFDQNMNPIRPDRVEFSFPGAGVVHDFCVTENWQVFSMPPASVDEKKALKALLGQAAFVEVIDFDKEATESTIYLVPRLKDLEQGTASDMKIGEDDRIKVIKVPYNFNFHFANAYEDEKGNVVLDSVMSEEVELGMNADRSVPVWEVADLDNFFPAQYTRLTIDPRTDSLATVPQVISAREPEFPSIPKEISTRRHRYAYTVGAHKEYQVKPDGRGKGANGAVLKLDTEDPTRTESFSFLPHEFVGEQYFCPKQGVDVTQPGCEDKGYLITYVENRRDLTTDMVIFDVEGKGALEKGPVTRIRMPTYIPPGLHGIFVEGLMFDV